MSALPTRSVLEGEWFLLHLSRRNFIKGTIAACAAEPYARAVQVESQNPVVVPGARTAGETNDTKMLQRAIDQAGEHGGGTVHIVPGRYLSGSLLLRSHVSLWLDSGATIVMSPDAADFFPAEKPGYDPRTDQSTADFRHALFAGDSIENVSIFGEGIIDCNRTKGGGPKPIALRRCSHLSLRGITIRNSPSYNISLLGCEFVTIDGITIQNGFSDGIDPDCSRYVTISNCFIESVDDAIVLKSSGALGERKSTEYVTVDNCVLRTASIHFKCGTESCGDFRNIAVANCVFQGGMGMRHGNPGIALYTADGGTLENAAISNIVMRDVGTPIAILRNDRDRCALGNGPGPLNSVHIANVIATGAKLPSVIAGLPGAPVTGIYIEGLSIAMADTGIGPETLEAIPESPKQYPQPTMFGPLPTFGFYLRHVSTISMRDLQLRASTQEQRPAIVADDVDALQLLGYTDDSGKTGSHLWFNNVRDSVAECIFTFPASPHSYRVSGTKTTNLYFKGTGSFNWNQVLLVDARVPRHAVHQQ
jgi:hypothetical protein